MDSTLSVDILYNQTLVDNYFLPEMTRKDKVRLLAYGIPRAYAFGCPAGFFNDILRTFAANVAALGQAEVPRSTVRDQLVDAIECKQELLDGRHGIAHEKVVQSS